MDILVILAHPNPMSFNHGIANMVIQTLEKGGHQVTFHDLYAEVFNPVMPEEEMPKDAVVEPRIKRYCRELCTADGIIIIHPNWWGQPPAILKGWIDRIFRPGMAYEFNEGDGGEGIPVGLLDGKTAIVLNTSNTPDEREKTVFGDPLETLWKNCIFGLCGVTNFHRKNFSVICTSTLEQRKAWLEEVRDKIRQLFPDTGERKLPIIDEDLEEDFDLEDET